MRLRSDGLGVTDSGADLSYNDRDDMIKDLYGMLEETMEEHAEELAPAELIAVVQRRMLQLELQQLRSVIIEAQSDLGNQINELEKAVYRS